MILRYCIACSSTSELLLLKWLLCFLSSSISSKLPSQDRAAATARNQSSHTSNQESMGSSEEILLTGDCQIIEKALLDGEQIRVSKTL